MQPEMKQLCTAFNKLRKLSVCGIFVEFDILWMMALLAAAPCIEILHIEVMYLSAFSVEIMFHFFILTFRALGSSQISPKSNYICN